MSETNIKAIAAHEKEVLSVLMPMARHAMPRIRKTVDVVRRFTFITYLSFALLKSSNEPSNNVDGLLFRVVSEKSIKYAFAISVTHLPFNGPFNPSCGATGESQDWSLKQTYIFL